MIKVEFKSSLAIYYEDEYLYFLKGKQYNIKQDLLDIIKEKFPDVDIYNIVSTKTTETTENGADAPKIVVKTEIPETTSIEKDIDRKPTRRNRE